MANNLGTVYVKVKADTSGLDRDFKKVKTQSAKAGGEMGSSFSNSFNSKLKSIISVTGIITVLTGVFKVLKSSLETFGKQEQAIAKVTKAVNQTGQAAGFTSDELQKVARDLQKMTTYGDEDILTNVTGQLLTFTNITGDAFLRAQQAVLDLNQVINDGAIGSLSSQSIQLGKALEDPIKGVAALSRSGVTFTNTQKDMIKKLVEQNDLLGAQSIILDEISNKYGGQAQAAASTFTGKLVQFNNKVGDVSESIGKTMIPALTAMISYLDDLATNIEDNEATFNILKGTFNSIATAAIITATAISTVWTPLKIIFDILKGENIFGTINKQITGVGTNWTDAFSLMSTMWSTAEKDIEKLISKSKEAADAAAALAKRQRELAETKSAREEIRRETQLYVDAYDERLSKAKQLYTDDIKRFKEANFSKAELLKTFKNRSEQLYEEIQQIEKDKIDDAVKIYDRELDAKTRIKKKEVELAKGTSAELIQIDIDGLNERKQFIKQQYEQGIKSAKTQHAVIIEQNKDRLKSLETILQKEQQLSKVIDTIKNKTEAIDWFSSGDSPFDVEKSFEKIDELKKEIDTLETERIELEAFLKFNTDDTTLTKLTAEIGISDAMQAELLRKMDDLNRQIALNQKLIHLANLKDIQTAEDGYYNTLKFEADGYYEYKKGLLNTDYNRIIKSIDDTVQSEEEGHVKRAEAYKRFLEYMGILDDEYAQSKKDKFLEDNEDYIEVGEAVGRTFTSAFHSVANEGIEAFNDAMEDALHGINSIAEIAFVSLANSFIREIERMIAKWLAFKALTMTLNFIVPGLGDTFAALTGADGGTFTSKGKIASFANGGSFTVPQGFPNDSFPMLVQSGEQVSVTPRHAVGQDGKLSAEILGAIQALNKTLMSKNMSVNVEANVDGLSFVKNVTKPAENRLSRTGRNMGKLK